MKFINSSVRIEPQNDGLEEMFKHIELCCRVSYKSEDRITEDSYKKFLKMLMNNKHTTPLEQGTIYLTIPVDTKEFVDEAFKVYNSKYAEVVYGKEFNYVTTNYNVLKDFPLEFVKKFWSTPTEHVKRVTMKIVCSRAISHEIVRHRIFSYIQESTRYCNYSKGKFDSELKFIIPFWAKELKEGDSFSVQDIEPDKIIQKLLSPENKISPQTFALISSHVCEENVYKELIKLGSTAQEARDVLSNGLKTELYMTGTIPQWEHFLSLRSPLCGATGVHPDMIKIGNEIYHLLVDNNYIKEVSKNGK